MGFNLIRQSIWALTKLSSWVLSLITKETQVESYTPLILALSTTTNRSVVLLKERDRGGERIERETMANLGNNVFLLLDFYYVIKRLFLCYNFVFLRS